MQEMLKVSNLSVNYGTGIDTLKNINFSIEYGQILGIIGESGSGKSTIARSILNILPRDATISSGKIVYKNKRLNKLESKEWQAVRGREIAIIFQNPGSYLSPILKIKTQFIETIRCNKKVSKKEAMLLAEELLRRMNLCQINKILNSYPFELSGGMLQRVMIAMVIAIEPNLIIADEPTSALDIVTQRRIIKELLHLKSRMNTSILFITHDLSIASHVADTIMVLKHGEVVEIGLREDILLNPQKQYTRQLLDSVVKLEELH